MSSSNSASCSSFPAVTFINVLGALINGVPVGSRTKELGAAEWIGASARSVAEGSEEGGGEGSEETGQEIGVA